MTTFVFTCPGCGSVIEVDASVRDCLLETGCVVCESSVTAEAFRRS